MEESLTIQLKFEAEEPEDPTGRPPLWAGKATAALTQDEQTMRAGGASAECAKPSSMCISGRLAARADCDFRSTRIDGSRCHKMPDGLWIGTALPRRSRQSRKS